MSASPYLSAAWIKRGFLALAFLILAGPLLMAPIRFDKNEFGSHARVAHPFPKFSFHDGSWKAFPSAFEAFYDDNFRLRGLYMRIFAFDTWHLFHVSPSSKVLVGRDGWLYYNDVEDGDPMATYRGENLFTAAELDSAYGSLAAWRDWLHERGIAFVVCIPPEKATIYPEHLPAGFLASNNRTRIDQFIEKCGGPGGIEIVDLRGLVLRAKGNEGAPLYFHTDTHWTPAGAYVGSSLLLKTLSARFPAIKPAPPSAFSIGVEEAPLGDLGKMIGIGTGLRDWTVAYRLHVPSEVRADLSNPHGGVTITVRDRPDLPSTVVFRDSFAGAMIPFLSEDFRRAVYIWDHQMDPRTIEREKPDVVILEMVERYVERTVGMLPPQEMLHRYPEAFY